MKKAKIDVLCIDEKKFSFHVSKEIETPREEVKTFCSRRIYRKANEKTLCLDLTIVKKKWCILFAYDSPNTDKEKFFHEISVSLKYEANMITSFLQVT